MLNLLWAGMILLSIFTGVLNGNLGAVGEAAVSSAKEAVELCITMTGVMSLWMGMMKIGERSGLMKQLEIGLRPLLRWLFPDIPVEDPAMTYIAQNFTYNVCGLGMGATAAGLRAIQELARLEQERREMAESVQISKLNQKGRKKRNHAVSTGTANNEMCTFLIINISSLQLIPVNIIAYRSQYGSVSPTAIVGPGILATLCSTLTAVVFCKIMMIREK